MHAAALQQWTSFIQSHSLENSTKRNYNVGTRSWLHFCSLHHLSPRPTVGTLCQYIAFSARYIKSVDKYLTGMVHDLSLQFPELKSLREDPVVKVTLRGAKKWRGGATKRKSPLLESHLAAILASAAAASASYDDVLFAAITVICFFGLLRLGEVISPTPDGSGHWRKIIRRGSARVVDGHFSFFLPYHKSDQLYEGNTVRVLPGPGPLNPLPVILQYLTARDARHRACPALFMLENGSLPTYGWYISRLRRFCPSPDYAGHSLRSGGATWWARRGLAEHLIQRLGRWKSNTFQIYIRENPAVLAALSLAAMLRGRAPPA